MLDDRLSKHRSAALSIKGAVDVQRMNAEIRFDDTIDASSIIALFDQIARANPLAKGITFIESQFLIVSR
jgi:polysaccharide deacetylase 2 family uncharacterized protein YibQ